MCWGGRASDSGLRRCKGLEKPLDCLNHDACPYGGHSRLYSLSPKPCFSSSSHVPGESWSPGRALPSRNPQASSGWRAELLGLRFIGGFGQSFFVRPTEVPSSLGLII